MASHPTLQGLQSSGCWLRGDHLCKADQSLQAVRESPALSIIGSWNDSRASHAPRKDLEPPGRSPATAACSEYKHREPGVHLDSSHRDPRFQFIKYATHGKGPKTTPSQTSSHTKYTPSTPMHSNTDPCYSCTEDIWR